MKELTIGVILVRDNKMLIIHPTGANNYWSIPKGKKEEGETDWQTAKRELYEETNINLDNYDYLIMKESSIYKYHKRAKYAKAFLVLLKEDLKNELQCNSFWIGREGKEIPECDDYKWVEIEPDLNIHYTQLQILKELI